MVETTTYGLRHAPTGKYVRIFVRDNGDRGDCGPETVELSYPFGELYMPRFECDLKDVLRVLSAEEDERWYNSSRDRPMRGNVDLSQCDVVSFDREARYDTEGGDPVFTSETVRTVLLPTVHPVRLNEARLTGRVIDLMPDAFGDEWDALLEASSEHGIDMHFDLIVLLANDVDGIPERGTIVQTENGNRAQVALAVDYPSHWPINRNLQSDSSEGVKLLACRWSTFVPSDHPLASAEGSEAPRPSR